MSSSVGSIVPNRWKNKIHVPNHQTGRVVGVDRSHCDGESRDPGGYLTGDGSCLPEKVMSCRISSRMWHVCV